MQCVDANVYAYLVTLSQLLQGASTVTPPNPPTTFTGPDVLGYFSAHSLRRRTLRLP